MLIDKRERFIFGHSTTNQSERDDVLYIRGRMDLFEKALVTSRRGVAVLSGKRRSAYAETGNRDHPRDLLQFHPAGDHGENLRVIQIESANLTGKLNLTGARVGAVVGH
jgi:hypothetical protein